MKGERQQEPVRNREERPFKHSVGDRALGVERSQAASVASAAAEFIDEGERRNGMGSLNRAYFNRPGERPVFLVLRDGGEERPLFREDTAATPSGPCLIRSEEWLKAPELAGLYQNWLSCVDEVQAERILQRICYRLRAAATELLESADGAWVAVTLLRTSELEALPVRLAVLQDAQLEALFAAVAGNRRQGGDSRVDLLAPYPASAPEFAVIREFVEDVAEQTLGHAYAAACRVGALIAPDAPYAAAGEIARIADFLVLDGAAGASAPNDAGAESFARSAGEVLAAVRRVKPAAVVLAAGAPAAAALADLYAIGMSGIFCSASQRTEALLRAACLTWMARQDNMDTAAGGLL